VKRKRVLDITQPLQILLVKRWVEMSIFSRSSSPLEWKYLTDSKCWFLNKETADGK